MVMNALDTGMKTTVFVPPGKKCEMLRTSMLPPGDIERRDNCTRVFIDPAQRVCAGDDCI